MQKEEVLNKNIPKRYHHNLDKTEAGLQLKAKDLPNLAIIGDPTAHEITSNPQTILNTLQTHFGKEQPRLTPNDICTPRWQNHPSPDEYITNRTAPEQPNTL